MAKFKLKLKLWCRIFGHKWEKWLYTYNRKCRGNKHRVRRYGYECSRCGARKEKK